MLEVGGGCCVVVPFVYVLAQVAQGWRGVLYLGVGLGSVPILGVGLGWFPRNVCSVPHGGVTFGGGFWAVPNSCWQCATGLGDEGRYLNDQERGNLDFQMRKMDFRKRRGKSRRTRGKGVVRREVKREGVKVVEHLHGFSRTARQEGARW